ncbi:MAG TPA: hypothetical protein VMU51_21300 [Mycobacteriales bacterium]|nr:hypothetical protein [Mycobacteriales bacterium]
MTDPRYPATWDEAMGRASDRLRAVETAYDAEARRHRITAEAAAAHADIARAWIAYAHELAARRPGAAAR